MTTPTLAPVVPLAPVDSPRPGSRADRMAMPLARDVLRQLAEAAGVCVRPLALRRTDRTTGQTEIIEVPCGARLASKCKPCAERNRRLRIQQIREGWHLADEPKPPVEAASSEVKAMIALRAEFAFERAESERASQWDQVADLDQGIAEVDEWLAGQRVRGTLPTPGEPTAPRRTRSTRRRRDVPDLPRQKVQEHTTGRVYAARDGKTHRPSMLLTPTLPSHGAVHTGARTRRGVLQPCECGTLHGQTDPLLGTPIDPGSYDYRTAALDAIHFAKVLDRWWQNLRRAGGWRIQYAGAVELQKRLAPHAHFAMRGTLPRALIKRVAAGTYHQVWWPHFDTPIYTVDRPPVWSAELLAYVDPGSGEPLTTWADAVDALDQADAQPAYVVRLGRVDARGITAGSRDAERSIRYVTKYVTKDLGEQAAPRSDAQRAHFDRLHQELSVLPCSPTCANWLLYGIQPDRAKPGLVPGRCTGKVHQPKTLGFSGRRVLVSRQWSNKTLADHRADNRAWVRAILAGTLADDGDQEETDTDPAGSDRYTYELARPDDPDVPAVAVRIMHAITTRNRWRDALRTARARPPVRVSATTPEALAA